MGSVVRAPSESFGHSENGHLPKCRSAVTPVKSRPVICRGMTKRIPDDIAVYRSLSAKAELLPVSSAV